MNYDNIIPILEKEVQIKPFDNDAFLLSQEKYRYEVSISNSTKQILELVNGKYNLQEIARQYNKKNNQKITPSVLYQLLYEKFSKYGVIKNDAVRVKPMSRASYLKLSFIFLPKNIVNSVSPYLTFAYRPMFSRLAVIFTVLFIALVGIFSFDKIQVIFNDFSVINYWYFAIAGFFAMIVHEFGHATAAKYYNIDSHGIGFGFYLFTPAFFTDISKVWRLKNKQRVVVDFGGIYFESLYVAFLLLLFLLTQNINFLGIAFLLLVGISYNLDPFFRTDGYWMISDSLKIPNLRKTSDQKLKQFGLKLIGKDKAKFSWKDWFMVVYAAVSLSFIVIFVVSVLLLEPDSVLYFPINIYNFVKEILQGNMHNWSMEHLMVFFLPGMFYFLVIAYLVKLIKHKKKD